MKEKDENQFQSDILELEKIKYSKSKPVKREIVSPMFKMLHLILKKLEDQENSLNYIKDVLKIKNSNQRYKHDRNITE